MVLLTLVKINSVDVTSSLVNYESEEAFGDAVSQVELNFVSNVLSTVTIQTGQTLEIWRGYTTSTDEKIFSGYIESYSPETGLIKIVAKDKLWDLIRKEVTKIYDSSVDASAGKLSEIFLDLVTTYGGLNADSTTVQDSGTVIVIDKWICDHVDVMDRCRQLAAALDWQFYYKPSTDKVYFEPKGYTLNPNTLTVGSNVYSLPKWNFDNTEMVNDLTVRGAHQELDTVETGRIGTTSGYTTASVTLTQIPISVEVYAENTNPPTVLLTGGVPDSTSDFDYYVDKEQKKIYPKAGNSFTSNDYFQINYSYSQPIPINQYNQSSIDAYGRFTKTIDLTDVRSVADAEIRGQKYLEIYSQPFIYATLKVASSSTLNLKIGDKIRVVDNVSPENVDELLVINRIRKRYPGDYDEIDVGDKFWRISGWQTSVEERLKRIQESTQTSSELLTQVVNQDNTSSPIQIVPRYRKVLSQTLTSSTIMIWDYPTTQGRWGNAVWGGDPFGSETNEFVQQYNDSYDETFIDEDFNNDAETTATWGTGSIVFADGETAESTSIDYNNGTITTATATFTGSGVGTPTFYLMANGADWEEVTSGTPYSFSSTGTDLRWKVDVAGGAYTLTRVQITDYH